LALDVSGIYKRNLIFGIDDELGDHMMDEENLPVNEGI
jgi:hypothetical protein